MLKRLLKEDRLNDLGNSEYLRTHPITQERLTDVENRAASLKQNHYKDSQEFLNCYEIEEDILVDKIKNSKNDEQVEKILEDYVNDNHIKN